MSSRLIKFRAWDTKTKKMYAYEDNYHFSFYPGAWILSNVPGNVRAYSDSDILMQFTGLYDKNGKEIYEGDIVRAVIFSLGEKTERVGRLEYIDKYKSICFVFRAENGKEKDYGLYYLAVGADDLEVIGNIYENPELLKDTRVSPPSRRGLGKLG